jgi:hypothetical protein
MATQKHTHGPVLRERSTAQHIGERRTREKKKKEKKGETTDVAEHNPNAHEHFFFVYFI